MSEHHYELVPDQIELGLLKARVELEEFDFELSSFIYVYELNFILEWTAIKSPVRKN